MTRPESRPDLTEGMDRRSNIVVLALVAAFLVATISAQHSSGVATAVRASAGTALVATLWWVMSSRSVVAAAASGRLTSSALVVTATLVANAAVFATWDTVPGAEDYLRSWPLYLAGLIEVILCLRGRPWAAVADHVLITLALTWRARVLDGSPDGALPALLSYLPMFLVAVFIAVYVRPVAGEITGLRVARSSAELAEDSARAAISARNRRLDWIDDTAGPWLRRLADGAPLDDADRESCRLLEAGIRDALRAPGLTGPELDVPVALARVRGVEVVLLDDGALDGDDPDLAAGLRRRVSRTVAATDTGRLTIRIGPPGREEVATILRSGPGAPARIVIHRADLGDADR